MTILTAGQFAVRRKLRQLDRHRILLAVSLLCSAPATAAILSLLMAKFSPIGLGSLSSLQAAALGIVFLSVVPTLTALHFHRKGVVDIEVSERKKRTPIYAVALGSQILAAFVFYVLAAKLMYVLSLAYIAVTAAILLINMKWKISAHTAGIAGPATALYMVFGDVALPAFLFLVPVFALRLKLKAHDAWQLIAGAIISAAVTYAVYVLWYL